MTIHFEEDREKTRFESDHVLQLNGQTIPYHTICEDNFFYNQEGKAVATLYSYSYFRSDVSQPQQRPVLFAYNGGPGSASLWLHLGLIGPRRLKLPDEIHLPTVPPFELEDNPNCLLDFCDLVVVDMVGTGLGRLFDEEAKDQFYDSDADIRQLALFVDGWLTRYHRRNSPIYLAGESYGTGRSCLLAAELLGGGAENQETLGISVSGILLLGCYFYQETPFSQTALALPSMAATYAYHFPAGKPDLKTVVQQAYRFVENEYLPAYYEGDALSSERKNALLEKMAGMTGLSKEFLDARWMDLTAMDYAKKLMEAQQKVVGYYDSRYLWKALPSVPDTNVIADDPAMGQYTPAYTSAFGLLRDELNIQMQRSSRGLSHGVNRQWNRKFKLSPARALAGAMRRNPSLRVFFASGLFDLCTTAGNARYLATHSHLDPARVLIREYPSGHMAYLGEESARLLGEDLRQFILDGQNHS